MTPGIALQKTALPLGFLCSGINCGVRRYRPDLGIIISEVPAITVGVFTQNECQAAPVLYCKKLLPSQKIRAIVTNSGQANAATFALGVENNLAMAQRVSEELSCDVDQILTASTGVIGEQLEIEKILNGVSELLNRVSQVAEPFALAILTTDLVPKTVSTSVELSGGTVNITGICKGSGMIHPNMATMLGYILSDISIASNLAQRILSEAVDLSFNMISVDGETSTNDTVFFMNNGLSKIKIENEGDLIKFQSAIKEIAIFMAKSIASDGEGATKLIEVHVQGAPNDKIARVAARDLVVSPLIKTAVHGEDPNWGRILSRLGAAQVPAALLDQVTLSLQNIAVYDEGGLPFNKEQMRQELKKDLIKIDVALHAGNFSATAWGCDLSKKYVEINAAYTT